MGEPAVFEVIGIGEVRELWKVAGLAEHPGSLLTQAGVTLNASTASITLWEPQ